MPIKKSLLASALIPIMAGYTAAPAVKAEGLRPSFEIAQAQPPLPEGQQVPEASPAPAPPQDTPPENPPAAASPAPEPPQPQPAAPAPEPQQEPARPQPKPEAPQAKEEAPRSENRRKPAAEPQPEAVPEVVPAPAEKTTPQQQTPPPAVEPRPAAPEVLPAPEPEKAAPAQAEDKASPAPKTPPAENPRPRRQPPKAEDGQPVTPAPAPAPVPAPAPAGKEPSGQPQGQPSQPPAQPVPAENGAEAQPPQPPAPPIEDTRSESERKAQANDPAKTDDTVVLPVENGAAVLDSDKDADNKGGQSARDDRRREREQQRRKGDDQPPPRNDAEAQRLAPQVRRADIEAGHQERGRRRSEAPDFLGAILAPLLQGGANQGGYGQPRQFDDRTVYRTDDGIVVRSDERRRLGRDAEETYYEDLARGRVRETIVRGDGGRIVTIYNRFGDVIQRSRFTPDGREYLLVYAPEAAEEQRPPVFRDPGDDLPPMRLRIPVRDYIADTSSDRNRDYYDFLAEPPVEQIERVYTLDEVKYSARLRDKVRRIDLDTITFATGSADVSMTQAKTVRNVAEAMLKVLDADPGETFLIEGHTDAVGSDESNLVLSDRRAEAVADLLTQVYGIPPENLVAQGYGERYLKVKTTVAEQQNRRVTIRRVTPLVRPATAGR